MWLVKLLLDQKAKHPDKQIEGCSIEAVENSFLAAFSRCKGQHDQETVEEIWRICRNVVVIEFVIFEEK